MCILLSFADIYLAYLYDTKALHVDNVHCSY